MAYRYGIKLCNNRLEWVAYNLKTRNVLSRPQSRAIAEAVASAFEAGHVAYLKGPAWDCIIEEALAKEARATVSAQRLYVGCYMNISTYEAMADNHDFMGIGIEASPSFVGIWSLHADALETCKNLCLDEIRDSLGGEFEDTIFNENGELNSSVRWVDGDWDTAISYRRYMSSELRPENETAVDAEPHAVVVIIETQINMTLGGLSQ